LTHEDPWVGPKPWFFKEVVLVSVKPLPTGKLDVGILADYLQRYTTIDARVLLGPQIGEDAAAIDMDETALIVTTDPITFATDEIGYYSVMVNANDIATCGAEPKWFTATILLPEQAHNDRLAKAVFEQIHHACEKLHISLIGGHTEITYGLDRPIVVGQMMGEVRKEALIRTGGAKPGDLVLMSKQVCVEGTSIIAREKEEDLISQGVSRDTVERAKDFLFDPGISIVEEARLAVEEGPVHAMHDITEGGLANGLHELALAGGIEIEVDSDRIPFYEESKVLCRAFGLNPLGVIGSGSLLITAPPASAEGILERAPVSGLSITQIGWVRAAGPPSVTVFGSGGKEPMPYFERDEIVKILG
jgi:hydrogenase maturation factor